MKSKFIITLLLTLFVGSISLTAQESNTTNEKKLPKHHVSTSFLFCLDKKPFTDFGSISYGYRIFSHTPTYLSLRLGTSGTKGWKQINDIMASIGLIDGRMSQGKFTLLPYVRFGVLYHKGIKTEQGTSADPSFTKPVIDMGATLRYSYLENSSCGFEYSYMAISGMSMHLVGFGIDFRF